MATAPGFFRIKDYCSTMVTGCGDDWRDYNPWVKRLVRDKLEHEQRS